MNAKVQRTYAERYDQVFQALQGAFAERLKTVVLFGSQARRDAHAGSDHDRFVVIDGLPRDPLARNRLVRNTLLPILDRLQGAVGLWPRRRAKLMPT